MAGRVSFEILNHAREIARVFVEAAGWSGWTDEQRRLFEGASAAVWACRSMLLADRDNPTARRRAATVQGAMDAALHVDLTARDSAPTQTGGRALTTSEVAKETGLRRNEVVRRAARPRNQDHRHRQSAELRLSADDVVQIMLSGRLR